MKGIINSMMLIATASILLVSCNEQKKELKIMVENMNRECPISLGDDGAINSIMLYGETIEMKFASNESDAPVSSLSNHPQELKEYLCIQLTRKALKKLVDRIVAAGVDFRVVFVGMQTGEKAEFTIVPDELKNATDKYSNMSEQQKLIVAMYIGTKVKLPIAIDNTTKLVGLSLDSDALKYKFEVNDAETGQNLDSSISFIKYVTLSQMANSLKGGIIGEKNRRFYQALISCNQGAEYEYHELQTGKSMSFRVSTDEIREVLNGKWDNQPTADEWEDISNSIERIGEEYDDEMIVDTAWAE